MREVSARKAGWGIPVVLVMLCVLDSALYAADEVPDFAGVWIGGGQGPQAGGRGAAGALGARRRPQLSAEAQQLMDDYDLLVDDPGYECSPSSISRAWRNPTPTEIEQRDDRVMLRHEFMDAVRTVFLDGRERPTDAPTSVLGHSTGRYEGRTLVIETAGFAPGWLSPVTGIVQTETLSATERLTLSEDGQRFSLELSFEDPATFTVPWTSNQVFVRRPDLELLEFGCVLEDAGYEDFNAP